MTRVSTFIHARQKHIKYNGIRKWLGKKFFFSFVSFVAYINRFSNTLPATSIVVIIIRKIYSFANFLHFSTMKWNEMHLYTDTFTQINYTCALTKRFPYVQVSSWCFYKYRKRIFLRGSVNINAFITLFVKMLQKCYFSKLFFHYL